MGLMREQFTLTLLFILFAIGFLVHNVSGACPRPVFMNPYAIILEPDQESYNKNFGTSPRCEEGHTSSGFPEAIYCEENGAWDVDISDDVCYAECNITEIIQDDDIMVTNDNNEQQTIFVHGEVANFTCSDKGQFTGSDLGTCDNGTLLVAANPTCLAYCPVVLSDLGVGLSFTVANTPVINETTTIYYRDADEVTYSCTDGYGDCTSDDCTSTCEDGSWDPPEIPVCVEIDECSSNPCQNNATCEDQINEYRCHCAAGFNGTNCEEKPISIEDTFTINEVTDTAANFTKELKKSTNREFKQLGREVYQQNADLRCFPILLGTIHQPKIALVFFYACLIPGPGVSGHLTEWAEPVTLDAGTTGVVTFPLQQPPNTTGFSLYYRIRFGSKSRSFCQNGTYDLAGFKNKSQVSRFKTTIINSNTFSSAKMTIDDVDIIDEDQYVLQCEWLRSENGQVFTVKKNVFVKRPAGRADCLNSSTSDYPYEVRSRAQTGSMPTTNRSRSVTELPTDLAPISDRESNVGSGTCRPFMIPSHWLLIFLCLVI